MLDFAKRLRDRIEKSGKYRVLMTRTDDTFVPLADRVRIARNAGAALFVSIHADWLPRKEGDAQGATVYTLSETAIRSGGRADCRGGKPRRRHCRRRSQVGAGRCRRHPDRSRAARNQDVFGAIRAQTGRRNEGATRLHKEPIKSAGFRVLRAPDVPSVLVELGYVSNKQDLQSLHVRQPGATTPRMRSRRPSTAISSTHVAGAARRRELRLEFVRNPSCRNGLSLNKNRSDERAEMGIRAGLAMRPMLPQWRAAVASAVQSAVRVGDLAWGRFRRGQLDEIGVAVKLLLRFLGFLFAAGHDPVHRRDRRDVRLLWHYSKDLPDYSQLQDYEPPVMTRVHAADGSLLAEYAKERRLYLPIQAIPRLVTNAFIAAEDKNFYQHPGIDIYGIMRAGLLYVENYGSGGHPQGASTITQQVAKNFLLTNEVSFERKIKEALLALRIERTYSKQKILELYLNEIYLGFGAYGVAAASLLYFDKSVHELTIAEAAYLAGAAQGSEQLQSVPPPRRGGGAPQLRDRPHGRGRLHHRRRRRQGEEVAARRHGAADRRAHLCRRIFHRGGAPLSLRQLRREEALRGRAVGAHHARSQVADGGAPDHDQRPCQFRREPRLSRPGHARSTSAAIGASSSPT